MAGEKSKKSGEIGEALSSALLEKIGWKNFLRNVSIDCNTKSHVNAEGNQRQSHGDDQIFLYHNPFHDDRTEIVHVSNKNVMGKRPAPGTLKSNFKGYVKELLETIECAKYSPIVKDLCQNFKARKSRSHAGLLIWFHNDNHDLECDIKPDLSSARLEQNDDTPIYLIDNERASFLIKVVDDLATKDGSFSFYFPRLGTAITVDENRSSRSLPLELIASDIIPAVIHNNGAQELVLYANQKYSSGAYKQLIAYGLNFSSGWVSNIHIGFSDYNASQDGEQSSIVRTAFHERPEHIHPFAFNRSILTLIGG